MAHEGEPCRALHGALVKKDQYRAAEEMLPPRLSTVHSSHLEITALMNLE